VRLTHLPWETPADWHHLNSPFSVEDINGRGVPWLTVKGKARLYPGVELAEARQIVEKIGGRFEVVEIA
jgi:hypothetical protein